MRLITGMLIIISALGCCQTKNITGNSNKLDGVWLPTKEEIGGRAIPNAAFATQKLIIRDSTYTFSAESVDKGVVIYKGDKMDIYGREGVNSGKHFTAIYKFENGELTICYNLAGDSYPPTFETKGKPMYFLCVFKKE